MYLRGTCGDAESQAIKKVMPKLNLCRSYLLLIIAVLYAHLGYAQKTKSIKHKIKVNNEVAYQEVLRSDPQVYHGDYELKWNWKFYKAIKVAGQYQHHQKEGQWFYYYSWPGRYGRNPKAEYIVNYQDGARHGDFIHLSYQGDTLQSGRYSQGKRSGTWRIFQSDTLIYHYDFSARENLLGRVPDYRADLPLSLLSAPGLNTFIYQNIDLKAPHKDSANYASGQIQIRCVIDADSTLHSPSLMVSGDRRVDEALLECIQNSKWAPALKKGKPVSVEALILVNYQIEWQGRGKNRLFLIEHYLPQEYLEVIQF